MKREEEDIARQRHGEHVFASTNKQATLEKLLEAIFSVLLKLGYSALS
jgi:hypothetical protein